MRSVNPVADSAALRSGLRSRLDALRVLADVTDGRAVVNTNAPGDQMASVMRETSSYYVLGFQSADATGAGRGHKIEVKVNRRGVRVQSRRGHGSPVDAPPPSASADSPPSTLTDAVNGLLPKTGLEIAVTAMPFASADRAEADVIVAVSVREPPNPSEPAGLNRARRRERGDLHRGVRPRGPERRIAAADPGRQSRGEGERLPIRRPREAAAQTGAIRNPRRRSTSAHGANWQRLRVR